MSSDFHASFKRDATGVHTVEGNLAGSRAAKLTKKREAQQAEYEAKKKRIQDEYKRTGLKINEKFGGSATDQFEAMFKARTVGLVTADEFRKAREDTQKIIPKEQSAAATENVLDKSEAAASNASSKSKTKMLTLSFGCDDEEESADELLPTKKVSKNPHVDTSFLPDKKREEELAAQKAKLREEWFAEQEKIRNEKLEVTYSYWDGTGHRRTIEITKGITIGKFLELVRHQLSNEFTELRSTSSDNLMYVKEDLIIPHSYSFYDLIVTKARGKSGPLFHFDVFDDIRMVNDVRIERDDSHPGKVVERRWYERSRHIFPASRWEIYDPSKDYRPFAHRDSQAK